MDRDQAEQEAARQRHIEKQHSSELLINSLYDLNTLNILIYYYFLITKNVSQKS